MWQTSLHEGSEMARSPKVKSGLLWRTQNIRGARAIIYLPQKAAYRALNQPKTKECIWAEKLEGKNRLSPLTMEMK